MENPTRAYVARLVGSAVFDPNGEQVGKVRDVVSILRYGTAPPRIVGLVVEVSARRRIFLPITRVTKMDAGTVVATGMIDLRRFRLRPTETLVVADLFDHAVTLSGTGQRAKILDLAMEQDQRRDWEITTAYVRIGGRGLGRRGQSREVPWSQIQGIARVQADHATESLLESLESLRPADVAQVVHELPVERKLEIARDLDDERLADVLEELPESDQVLILSQLGFDRAADVLEEMDPDDAADLLNELEPEQAEQLLGLVEPEDAEDIRRLLLYDDLSAGGMMSPEPLIVGPDTTIAEALAMIRNPDLSPALASQVYVVRPPMQTPTGRYVGVAHFQRLLREMPSDLVSRAIDKDLEPIGPSTALPDVTRYFASYNLVAVPVVDENQRLLGALTVDDLLDHMLPDNWRDAHRQAGHG